INIMSGPPGSSPRPSHACDISIQERGITTAINASISTAPANLNNHAWIRNSPGIISVIFLDADRKADLLRAVQCRVDESCPLPARDAWLRDSRRAAFD